MNDVTRAMDVAEGSSSRVAGLALLGTLATIVLEHGVGQAIGGASLYGVRDAGTIVAFYGHSALRDVYWACAGLVLFLVPFGLAFRALVGRRSFSADLAVALILVEIPLLVAHYGLALALVDRAPMASAETVLALHAAWEAVYHPVEWMEVGWMAAIAVASWRTGVLPRWSAAWAGAVSAGLAFNVVGRHLQVPESALMPTYALFSLWMLATAVVLFVRPRR